MRGALQASLPYLPPTHRLALPSYPPNAPRLQAAELESRLVPLRSLDQMVVAPALLTSLRSIVALEKARAPTLTLTLTPTPHPAARCGLGHGLGLYFLWLLYFLRGQARALLHAAGWGMDEQRGQQRGGKLTLPLPLTLALWGSRPLGTLPLPVPLLLPLTYPYP